MFRQTRLDLPTISLIVVFAICQVSLSQQQLATGDNHTSLSGDPVYQAWGTNPEVKQCGLCHYSPGNEFASRETDFCQLDEAKTWLASDLHAISRQRVEPLSREQITQASKRRFPDWLGESNSVSFVMCQKLGYDVQSEAGYAKFRDNCLTCHAGYDPRVPSIDFAKSGAKRPGISCNYCHQVGETTAWVDNHGGFSAKQTWRLLSPQAKAAAGMRNLVDVRLQAKLCVRCHIGDHASGMVVTHEMYVAGHPPLPGFELQSFITAMPMHWRSAGDTYASLASYSRREEYFELNFAGHTGKSGATHEDTFWETRTMLVGAIEAAGQSVAMLSAANNDPNQQHWGDYALYDCAACHHELRLPSFRQQRQAREIPGRPRLLEWTTPLLETVLHLFDSNRDVGNARRELMELVNATPFGDPAQCVPAAQRLRDSLDQISAIVCQSPLQAEQARQIISLLVHTPRDSLLDYHSARQVIRAIQLVDQELASHGQALSDSVRKRVAELGKQDQQILIAAGLPPGRGGWLTGPADTSQFDAVPADARRDYLAAELERLRQYDPQIIQLQLRELSTQLNF